MTTANKSIRGESQVDNAKIRADMEEIQKELQNALCDLLAEVGPKLKPNERTEIQQEFDNLEELLERLKSGFVWIALFGKSTVGKSSILNSLLGTDEAKVHVKFNCTTDANEYEKSPWMIIDMPGISSDKQLEDRAINDANKAHGHIFVIDGEPSRNEMNCFEAVHKATPNTPKIVFVNKLDELEQKPPFVQKQIRALIQDSMGKFVKSPTDIVYGNAMSVDMTGEGAYIRQEIPQLVDKLYEDAGTLGAVMNVLDPADRAEDLGNKMRDKILEIRMGISRKVISHFGTLSVAGGFIPFTDLVMTPGILASMVYTVSRIMGHKMTKESAKKMTIELIKASGKSLGIEAGIIVAADAAASVLTFLFAPIGVAAFAGISYFKYRRTVILGEVAIEFLRNDCSWGGEDRYEVIKRCKERAQNYYMRLQKSNE